MKWQYIVIVFVLCNFVRYVIQLRKKEGIIIDLWAYNHIAVWLWYFIIYPFADSIINWGAVGSALWNIHRGLEEAFKVTFIGYAFLWIGKFVYDHKTQSKNTTDLTGLSKKIFLVYATHRTRNIYILFHIPFFLLIGFYGLMYWGNDIREIIGVNAALRPIMNLVMTACSTFISIYSCLYLHNHKKIHLYYSIIFSLFAITLSSRAVLFSPIVMTFIFYAISRGRKISFSQMVIIGLVVIIGIFSLAFFRKGNLSDMDSTALLNNILYGSTFSDIRDFAWVLGYWDHELLQGKTYIAGIFSFIPSAISEFRQQWGLGHFTLMTTGLYSDDSFHGGLRCTIFGESYFNFGLIGVIIISFIYGYYFEKINRLVISCCKQKKYIEAFSIYSLCMFLNLLTISADSFRIYCIIIPILILYKLVPRKRIKKI